jgi:hypothetical protein
MQDGVNTDPKLLSMLEKLPWPEGIRKFLPYEI